MFVWIIELAFFLHIYIYMLIFEEVCSIVQFHWCMTTEILVSRQPKAAIHWILLSTLFCCKKRQANTNLLNIMRLSKWHDALVKSLRLKQSLLYVCVCFSCSLSTLKEHSDFNVVKNIDFSILKYSKFEIKLSVSYWIKMTPL